MIRNIFLLIACTMFTSAAIQAVNLTGNLGTHDPSRIMKEGDRYWFFSTGNGIPSTYSDNLTNWVASGNTVFPIGTWPSWINAAVPGFGGTFWAPDLIYMNGAFYLYYSCSTFGSSRSAIGVARSTSLNEPEWTDLGMVVSSNGTSTAINAIDPGLFRDSDGKVYMVYGSWFGGIGMVEIDTLTGEALTSTTYLYGGSHQSIEAANMIKEGGYYYLIVNRGNCCQGVNSTYYITVGRSESVQGPYSGFGTILQTSGKYIGPGHFGPYRDSCGYYVSIHYYDKDYGGMSKLDILKLTFYEGWPELTRDFTFEDCDATGFIHSPAESEQSFNIFPNPVENNSFSIELPVELKNETVRVEIYRLDGRKVYHKDFSFAQTINLDATLGKGIYLVKLKNGFKNFTQLLSIM